MAQLQNNSSTEQSRSIPQLRFPEFDGEWESKKLGDISTFSKGKGLSKSDITENGINKCIRYGELYTKYNEVIDDVASNTDLYLTNCVLSDANDVIIPASGETQIDIATASCVLNSGIILGGDLNIIKTKNNGVFLSYYLNNRKKIDIARLSQGISVVHLYSSQLGSLSLNIPTLPEQQKIANFLTAIDSKLQALKKKKELLEQYKKGVMQKIFSQELRFKPALSEVEGDDEGNDFADWEVKKLGEVCEMTSSKRVYLSDYVEKGVPFYRGKEITELKNNKRPSDILYITEERYLDYKSKYGVPQKNDILITAVGTLGNVLRIRNNDRFYFKDGNLIWLRNIKEDPGFLEILIQWNTKELIKTSIGSTQKALTMIELRKIGFFFPSIEEQTQIANFLSTIDTKIEKTTEALESTQQYKKGLLQQMFV